MKRFLLSTALLWSATGYVVSDPGETFQPTRPGYYLFRQSYEPLCDIADDLRDVFAFARYYVASTEEEREKLHDAFFYSKRITRNGNTWRIIDSWMEVEIATGGLPLQAEEAHWTINYNSNYDKQKRTLTIGRDTSAADRYTLLLSENFGTLTGRFSVETTFATQVPESGIRTFTVKLSIAGEGHATAHDVGIDFTIRTPLRYDSSAAHAFTAGAMRLITDGKDTAEAVLEGYDIVKIEYNGHQASWNCSYYWFPAE